MNATLDRLARVKKRTLNAQDRSTLVAELAKHILSVYDRSTVEDRVEGRQWYAIARDHAIGIARRNAINVDQATALIALTSPRQQWSTNLALAEAIANGSSDPFFTYQRPKARAILAEPDSPHIHLNGPKVTAFYRNILGDETAVTVDIWAVRVAVHDGYLGDLDYGRAIKTVTKYDIIADAYRKAAYERNVTPMTMQATCWIMARDRAILDHPQDALVAPF